jgi:hypothetical protein
MYVFKKQSTIKCFVGLSIVQREKDSQGYINLTANEMITDNRMIFGWVINSVVNAALEDNDCPIAAYKRAEANKHEMYWLSPEVTAISSRKAEQKTYILIKDDDIIRFEGKLFTVKPATNNNKTLVPY